MALVDCGKFDLTKKLHVQTDDACVCVFGADGDHMDGNDLCKQKLTKTYSYSSEGETMTISFEDN